MIIQCIWLSLLHFINFSYLLNLTELYQDGACFKHSSPFGQSNTLQFHYILCLHHITHSYGDSKICKVRSWSIEVLNDVGCGKSYIFFNYKRILFLFPCIDKKNCIRCIRYKMYRSNYREVLIYANIFLVLNNFVY